MVILAHVETRHRLGTVLVRGYDHAARRADGSEPWVVVVNYNTAFEWRRCFRDQAEAEKWLGASVDWSWLHPAKQLEFDGVMGDISQSEKLRSTEKNLASAGFED